MTHYTIEVKPEFRGTHDVRTAVYAVKGIRLLWYFENRALIQLEGGSNLIEALRALAGDWLLIREGIHHYPLP